MSDRTALGGKGYALKRLEEAGFRVPAFIILPVSFFEDLDAGGGDPLHLIRSRLEPLIAAQWGARASGRFAVRSSATVEDSSTHSYAGQFKTVLNVVPDSLAEAVVEVWRSAGSSHAYANANGIRNSIAMAVIVQKMIPASAAGVAFSANPLNGTEEVLINAVRGTGEKLVDGSESADTYILRSAQVASRQLRDSPAILSDAQLLEVERLARQAQQVFGSPQDIEFAFDGPALYMLQSRPITTLPTTPTTWDNSNIVESYPGLTLPLTFTFIQKMYESVYRQFSGILGVPQQKIDRHGAAFANMLGLLNGRVYYNLNSWYEALALLPGYSLNAAFMERMMGVKEKPDISIAVDRSSTLKGWWEVIRALRGIWANLRKARSGAIAFETAFNKVYQPFATKELTAASLQALWSDYSTFESLMLREWRAPLVNDFFAMIYFGLLQKRCLELAPEESNLHNRLLAGSDAVLTTQPMRELPKIIAAISERPDLLAIARNGTPGALAQALQQDEQSEAGTLFRAYIETWGERSVAELKLETITYRQDPGLLASLLQSYLVSGNAARLLHRANGEDRIAAEILVAGRLRRSWLKRKLFQHILRNARYFVSQRENLRYYRTRGFGMVRRIMLEIGERLMAAGVIAESRDVFWLELQEIGALATESTPRNLQLAVSQRKQQYAQFYANPLPQRLRSYGPPKGLIGEFAQRGKKGVRDGLTGIPCSAGIVRAPVRLVTYSDELQSLDGAILATYATDPGFVVLFASASGILTERGSLLSHAAIVSREMGIPCIVALDGLMSRLQDGDIVEMDGGAGTVRILRDNAS